MGYLNINWLTPSKITELTVLGEKGMFFVNYFAQDITFYKNGTVNSEEWDTLEILRGVGEGEMTRFVLLMKEPLRVEQEAFLPYVKGEIHVPVLGEDGLLALKLAQAIIISGKTNQLISF